MGSEMCIRDRCGGGLFVVLCVLLCACVCGVCVYARVRVCEFYVFYLMDLGVRDPVPRVEALGSAAKRC